MAPKIPVTAEKIRQLPKWVQDHIQTLTRRAEDSEREVKALYGHQEESRVWIEGMQWDDDKRVFLTDKTNIVFNLKPKGSPLDKDRTQTIQVRIEEERPGRFALLVSGYEGLMVKPHVSNAVKILTDKR